MAYLRIHKYTSIARMVDPAFPTNRAVLILIPLGFLLGLAVYWQRGGSLTDILAGGLSFALILFGSWALARELDPDDHAVAFLSMALSMLAAAVVDAPGVLVIYAAIGLVRIVNRSTGLVATRLDSVILMLLAIAVMYATDSPYFGAVAALAFVLDGSLKAPSRSQWIFALVCFGGTIVYMVDHDVSPGGWSAPDTLYEWLALMALLIYALNILLLRQVHSKGDTGGRPLDLNRVRGGMAVGLFAALQGLSQPHGVVILITVIAGIVLGMALRKGFKAPAAG